MATGGQGGAVQGSGHGQTALEVWRQGLGSRLWLGGVWSCDHCLSASSGSLSPKGESLARGSPLPPLGAAVSVQEAFPCVRHVQVLPLVPPGSGCCCLLRLMVQPRLGSFLWETSSWFLLSASPIGGPSCTSIPAGPRGHPLWGGLTTRPAGASFWGTSCLPRGAGPAGTVGSELGAGASGGPRYLARGQASFPTWQRRGVCVGFAAFL